MAASKKHLLAASVATAFISLVGLAGPSYADPLPQPNASETAATVQEQIVAKQAELAAANEEYLDAKLELEKQNAAQAEAEAQLAAAQTALADHKQAVADLGAEQFKSGALPTGVMLLAGDSPSDFIDKANVKVQVDSYNDEKIQSLADAEAVTAEAEQQAETAQAAAEQAISTIADKKSYIEAELPKLEEKLATLTEQERQALEAAQGGDTPAAQQAAADPQAARATEQAAAPAPAAGSAATVVNWAMSQIGKPYVWGGAGPNGYDCSGLTMRAYEQIGISLPHSSSAQRSFGSSVSLSALQPGDLVFAPGHVAIYIGNGTVVHAPTFGSPVRTMPMEYMSFDSARRLV